MARISWISLLALLLVAGASAHSKEDEHRATCAKLLRVPAEHLADYMKGVYTNNHEGYCFMRCVGVLFKAYDDETGLDLPKLFPAFGAGLSEEEFTQKAQTCLDELAKGEPVKCPCQKAYKRMACMHTFTFKEHDSSESHEHQDGH